MKTSRQQILEYVQAHRAVTAGDLSRALHMTAANVRRHLSILQEQGRVEVVGQRPARGKGRPSALFAPSEQFLGDNLRVLSSVLLQEAVRNAEQAGERDVLMKQLAARLAASMSSGARHSGKGAGSLTQRLYQAIQCLESAHYQARWEAHIQGPRLILGHCPYAAILDKHPELCKMDVYLLGELVGERVIQVAKLEKDMRGMKFCMFEVRGKAPGDG